MSGENQNPLPSFISAQHEAIKGVQEYRGSPPFKALLVLLRELEASHLQDLRRISAEDLASTQGKLAQVEALRLLLEGSPHADGKA